MHRQIKEKYSLAITSIVRALVIVFTFITVTAYASSEKLESLLNDMHSVKARFEQKIMGGDQQVLVSSKGTMYLMRPGKFRWEVDTPNKQLLIVDQHKVWFYDVDLEQVSIRHVDLQKENTPAMLLSESNNRLLSQFHIKTVEESQGRLVFLLRSKNKDASYQDLFMIFKNDKLYQMRILDALGQTTTLTFNQVKLNQPLSASLFTFKVPEGVDVVEQ